MQSRHLCLPLGVYQQFPACPSDCSCATQAKNLDRDTGSVPLCRFRYRPVPKQNYGLDIVDLLQLDAKELNQVLGSLCGAAPCSCRYCPRDAASGPESRDARGAGAGSCNTRSHCY